MLKNKKTEVVEELKSLFSSHESVMMIHYHGLNSEKITRFRKEMKENQVSFIVVKNTLARIAVQDTGFNVVTKHMSGPTALIITNNAVSAAKVLMKFIKDNEDLKYVGGCLDGNELSFEDIKTLSKLPSLDELRARLIALINTPASSLVSILGVPGGNVARVINAYSKSNN